MQKSAPKIKSILTSTKSNLKIPAAFIMVATDGMIVDRV
jgi:hypothetical protein